MWCHDINRRRTTRWKEWGERRGKSVRKLVVKSGDDILSCSSRPLTPKSQQQQQAILSILTLEKATTPKIDLPSLLIKQDDRIKQIKTQTLKTKR